MWLLKILIKHFLLNPPKILKKWIRNFLRDLRRNPILVIILAIPVIYIVMNRSYLLFIHKNSVFLQTVKDLTIEDEINLALNSCGNGTTIAKMVIGEEFMSDDKISFTFDQVRSCDKSLLPYREDKRCDLDVKWLNPAWREIHEIDHRTLEVLNSDVIHLGKDFNIIFKDGQPIWLKIFNSDGTLTKEGSAIKFGLPKLFDMLDNSKRTIKDIGVVKVMHPYYKHIVYLFTMSFWYNNYGLPDMNCEEDKTKILRRIYKKQRQELES